MPKKPPKNAYFYFMLDFKNREAARGRNLSMPQAAQEASSEWEQMGPDERRPYEIRAKSSKAETKVKKYTTLGQDIEILSKKEKEKQDSTMAMQQHIKEIVMSSPYPPELEFFVGYVNYYCYCSSLNKYLPAEISIIRFSLSMGADLNDIFHVILDTGNLPIGYRLVANKQSEDTHGIPPPPHEGSDMREISEKDMRQVLKSMCEFLRKNSTSKDRLPPVYFDHVNMPIAKDVFQNFVLEFGDSHQEIPVYSLLHLFHELRTNAKKDKFPITLIQAELERDIYDFVQGISCQFHSVTDQYQHCSLSHVIRKVFLICDYTNPCYGIQLVPGKHVPQNSCAQRLINQDSLQDEAAALPVQQEPLVVDPPKPKEKEPEKKPVRLPTSQSFVASYQKPEVSNPQSENYQNDFPALGGGDRPRPAAIGRGRGRILQNSTK